MSVPKELQLPGRTRSMDAELQSERWDFVITLALMLPLWWVAFGFAQHGDYINCAAVALPAAGFLLRSIIRFSNV